MSFQQYFIDPVLQNGWFNPVNTIAYSIILIIAVYAVYRLLRRMDIRIDRNFFLAVLPFIFWGSSTRVLHDAAVAGALSPGLTAFYIAPIFPTPGSYIITFSLALGVLLVSLLAQRFLGFPYWKAMLGAGLALCAINMYLTPMANLMPMLMILGLTGLWAGIVYVPSRLAAPRLMTAENQGILSCHMLDASATFVALSFFGYLEQHVVPRLFIVDLGIGPAIMFILKLAVVIPVLLLIDRYTEKGSFQSFLKIVILILGLAPGLRDMLRLIAMV